ncbi:MAG TPA: hypothetical protein VGK26_07040 [Thermoanaerobaculia bacterium]
MSYATLSRRFDGTQGAFDVSDVTPKILLVGAGEAWPAASGLGTGTPAAEWRARFAVGPSHDEQRFLFTDQTPILTTGTGRFLNFDALGRIPVDSHDSVELGVERREHAITDFSSFVFQKPQVLFLQRSLTASRLDAAAGWRHRWENLEAAASVRWTVPYGRTENDDTLYRSRGSLFGGAAEVRWRLGHWTVGVAGDLASGSLDVEEHSTPASVDRTVRGDARLASVRPSVSFAWNRWDLFGSVGFERQRLPFVALAVLSEESAALQSGRHFDSDVDEVFWDVRVRHAFAPALSALVALRLGYGQETVTLTDTTGAVVSTLHLRRRGIFGGGLSGQLGSPELTFYVGANFALGSP